MATEEQKELLRHMLGADYRYKKRHWGFRNYFCSADGDNNDDRLNLEKMELDGLVKSGHRLGYKMFFATKEGAIEVGFKPYQLRNTDLA